MEKVRKRSGIVLNRGNTQRRRCLWRHMLQLLLSQLLLGRLALKRT